jgi:hypothetical protein
MLSRSPRHVAPQSLANRKSLPGQPPLACGPPRNVAMRGKVCGPAFVATSQAAECTDLSHEAVCAGIEELLAQLAACGR